MLPWSWSSGVLKNEKVVDSVNFDHENYWVFYFAKALREQSVNEMFHIYRIFLLIWIFTKFNHVIFSPLTQLSCKCYLLRTIIWYKLFILRLGRFLVLRSFFAAKWRPNDEFWEFTSWLMSCVLPYFFRRIYCLLKFLLGEGPRSLAGLSIRYGLFAYNSVLFCLLGILWIFASL